MNKSAPLAAVAAFATLAVIPTAVFAETTSEATKEAAAPLDLSAGKMLYSSQGSRVAPIYRVTAQGNAQVILNGRLVTVPGSSLSSVDGKVITSLSKKEIASTR